MSLWCCLINSLNSMGDLPIIHMGESPGGIPQWGNPPWGIPPMGVPPGWKPHRGSPMGGSPVKGQIWDHFVIWVLP